MRGRHPVPGMHPVGAGIMRRSPKPAQPSPGGRPLDPEQTTPDPARPPGTGPDHTAGAGSPPDRSSRPPGLREQLRATFGAAVAFVQAHVALAKAEFDEIKGEIGRAAALGGVAVASLILLALLLSIGGMLFAGEWIFGSIGWGVLLGAELLVAVAVTAVLVALRVRGLGIDVVIALVMGVVAGIVLGLDLFNAAFAAIGDGIGLEVDPAVRPLVVGLVVVAILGALVGLVVGARSGGGRGAVLGLLAGLIAGAAFGAFLSITFGPRVGAALGVATFLLAWTVLEVMRVQRQGIDLEELKSRFYPDTTIDTTKESIEWAKARVARGRRS